MNGDRAGTLWAEDLKILETAQSLQRYLQYQCISEQFQLPFSLNFRLHPVRDPGGFFERSAMAQLKMLRASDSRTCLLWSCLLLGLCGSNRTLFAETPSVSQNELPTYLADYVARPEPDYSWKLLEASEQGSGKIYQLELTSQKWQGIVWTHPLQVFEPSQLTETQHMILFVTGGTSGKSVKPFETQIGRTLAELTGARVAMIHHVPNQPLLENRREDDLISETWLRYLKTGDSSWPLLFPMTKSAVKAMDALQEFSRRQFKEEVKGFVVTGGSKRGWTSWLTAAADQRVIATAPMVIDVLNFAKQMPHQKATWGFYSEQIRDYTSKGLVHEDGIPKAGREGELWKMMDPYSYRSQVSIPKLMIVGANDRYWATDAMNLYWDDLPGEKYACRIANAGHNLHDGNLSQGMVMQTLAVFFKNVVAGKSMPQVTWTPQQSDDGITLSIQCDQKPTYVRLWSATSNSKDFRDSKWEYKLLWATDGKFVGHKQQRPDEHVAVFGEMMFGNDVVPYSLSTLVYLQ